MPDRVVDAPEAVQVEVEQGHRGAITLCTGQRESEVLVQNLSGRQTCEEALPQQQSGPAVSALASDRLRPEAAEVEDGPVRADRYTAAVPDDRVALPDPAWFPVGADDPVLQVELLAAVEELLLGVANASHVVGVNARVPELRVGKELGRPVPGPLAHDV